jgi:hypothetical protein
VGGAKHGGDIADGAMPPVTSGGLAGVEVGEVEGMVRGGVADTTGGGLAGAKMGECGGTTSVGGTAGTTSGG